MVNLIKRNEHTVIEKRFSFNFVLNKSMFYFFRAEALSNIPVKLPKANVTNESAPSFLLTESIFS